MTLEEALISIGDRPITNSPYSQAIQSIVMASLGKKGDNVTKETPGYVVLRYIYAMTNHEKRDRLLSRKLGAVRSTDVYKQAVLFGAAILVFIAIVIAFIEVTSEAPISDGYVDILKTVVQGVFDLLRLWLESEAAAKVPSM